MTISEILNQEYSEQFDRIRKNMVATSFYKYGPVKDNVTTKIVDTIKSLEIRLDAYKKTGNTEFLADIANFAMFEYMYPQHPNGDYKPTDSTESPGISGMSVQELKDYG